MLTGRVMALDVGKIRVGVALSDPLGYTAQPLLTLWRKSRGEDMRNLLRLIRKHDVTELVVGKVPAVGAMIAYPFAGAITANVPVFVQA